MFLLDHVSHDAVPNPQKSVIGMSTSRYTHCAHCGSCFNHSALIPVRAATARMKGKSFSMRAFTLWLGA